MSVNPGDFQANFETVNYESTVADTDSFEQWSDAGSLDAQQRANSIWKQMLADYEPPEMDAAVHRELIAFIEDRKSAVPDMWY